jgi:hypothetical protein
VSVAGCVLGFAERGTGCWPIADRTANGMANSGQSRRKKMGTFIRNLSACFANSQALDLRMPHPANASSRETSPPCYLPSGSIFLSIKTVRKISVQKYVAALSDPPITRQASTTQAT